MEIQSEVELTESQTDFETGIQDKSVVYNPNPSVSYDPHRDAAAQQLLRYKMDPKNAQPKEITTLFGAVIGDITNVLTIGPRGPMLMEDRTYQDEMSHFDRERIPERIVHAKGGGAFGYFETTNPDMPKICTADLFSRPGMRTPVAARFSTVAGERGSADTVRDPRGFAIKFYTQEGVWDLVGNNTPVFFIRDPFMFMSFIHSQKRNPQTNLTDYNARWDFFTLRHEALYQVTWMFGDRGIPDGFRHMDGWSSSAYQLINSKKQANYVQFYWKSCQGVQNLDVNTANKLRVSDPDYSVHDLFDAIACKAYPSWILHMQVMTPQQAKDFEFNPFDITKVWPEDQFPLIEIGRMVLDRNPLNYFAEIEQIGFCPINRVPGIEFSPDKMLQGRLYSYQDTQRHRLGPNFNLIPVNHPINAMVNPVERDGYMQVYGNQGNLPNYYPNSFSNVHTNPEYIMPKERVEKADIYRFESKDEDNYTQVRDLYLSYTMDEKQRLFTNIATELSKAYDFIQDRAYDMFCRVDESYGDGVRRAVQMAKHPNM